MGRIIEAISFAEQDKEILEEIKKVRGMLPEICRNAVREWAGQNISLEKIEKQLADLDMQDSFNLDRRNTLLKHKEKQLIILEHNNKLLEQEKARELTPEEKKYQFLKNLLESKAKCLTPDEIINMATEFSQANVLICKIESWLLQKGLKFDSTDLVRVKQKIKEVAK